MFGCYRKGDANDPAVYVAAVAAVLADYSPDIIRDVTDPRIGLPSKISWPPTVKEVKSACEDIAGPRRRAVEWEREAARALEQRALPPPPRLTREQIEAKLGRKISDPGKPAVNPLTNSERDALLELYGVSRDTWDAIPRHRTS